MNLAAVEAVVGAWCDQVDPALLTGRQAAEGAERLAGLIRRLSAKQTALAARAAECRSYNQRALSPEEWLAKQNGTSRSEAKRALDTMKRMKDCPAAAEAFDQGNLSLAEADAVTGAAVLDPSAERALVEKATGSHDLSAVRDAADKVKRAAHSAEDEAARLKRLRAGRRWRQFTTAEGHTGVDARFVPEDLAAVMPVINAFTEAQFEAGRRAGTRDTHEAYRADGVLAAFAAAGASIGLTPPPPPPPAAPCAAPPEGTGPVPTGPAGGGSAATPPTPPTFPATRAEELATEPFPVEPAATPAPVVPPAEGRGKINWSMCVIVDGIALKRGWAAPGETCEIPGIGPVSVAWARTLLDDAVVDALVHDTVDIRAYSSVTRHKPRPVQLALKVRDRTCQVPGCARQWRLEADHHHDFALGGITNSVNCGGFCGLHHYEKTHLGARIEITDTEILWWPPPPPPGTPPPPEGSIPWRAPRGEHLHPWDLDHLPGTQPPDPDRSGPPDEPDPPETSCPSPDRRATICDSARNAQ